MRRNRRAQLKIVAFSILAIIANKIYSQPANFYANGCGYFTQNDPIEAHDKDYQLVFEDDFNGTALNTTDWQTYYPWGRALQNTTTGTGWERQYYSDDNAVVSGGYLHLITKIDPSVRNVHDNPGAYDPPQNVFFKYTSGMIYTKVPYKSGRFEIKAKVPYIDGVWPAFWLFGDCAQELDVFEMFNPNTPDGIVYDPLVDSRTLFMDWHREGVCHDGSTHCHRQIPHLEDIPLSADFHTYAIDWDETKIVWTLDATIIREVYRYWSWDVDHMVPLIFPDQIESASNVIEFNPFPKEDAEMHLIINTAVGEKEGTTYPKEFLIDYVKIYAKSDCYTDRLLCENNTIAPGIIASKTITTNPACDFTISGGSQPIEMKAIDEISLNPGFSSELNSDFYAHLSDCDNYNVRSLNTNLNTIDPPVRGYSDYYPSTSSGISSGKENVTHTLTSSNSLEFNVYPNPSNGEFSIVNINNEKTIAKIEVQNVLGDYVSFLQTATNNEIKINLFNQPKGVYILKISCEGKTYVKKIIYN